MCLSKTTLFPTFLVIELVERPILAHEVQADVPGEDIPFQVERPGIARKKAISPSHSPSSFFFLDVPPQGAAAPYDQEETQDTWQGLGSKRAERTRVLGSTTDSYPNRVLRLDN